MKNNNISNKIIFVSLTFLTFVFYWYGKEIANYFDSKWILEYPKHHAIPFAIHTTSFVKWLINEASFGLFTFKELTRFFAWIIEQPYKLVLIVLSKGILKGQGQDAIQLIGPLSWLSVIGIFFILALYTKDKFLIFLVIFAIVYLAVFDQWQSSMITLSSIIIAVPIGVLLGLLLGVLSYKSKILEKIITPILDLMQTVPVFAYLVPILVMFGFGPVSALIATIIYAMPPMVRTTILALNNIDPQLKESGIMSGCTDRQLMWKVLIPVSKPTLLIGVNQVIMLSLNMVIIASMIGAGGLGYDVLASLRRLDIGGGIESGIAIVVLAIILDRLSQAFANLPTLTKKTQKKFYVRYKKIFFLIFYIISIYTLGYFYSFFKIFPNELMINTSSFWEELVKYININYFDNLENFKIILLTYFMLPIKKFFLGVPWPWFIFIITLIGWYYGKLKLASLCLILSIFIVTTGLWQKAMITLYLCGSSVIIASIIGIPLGIWAGLNNKANKILTAFIDTLQTLPSFVYLIPVVMLFRVGDFTAMIAVILYALAPSVRYTAHGIRNINNQIVEAALISGCSPRQLLFKIKLPLALPEILLGINQTIMLALSMLVITALVGTRDLGQEVYIGLTKADIGRGLVAGLCVAFISIIADRIIKAGSDRLKNKYGIK
jgi:glycine betaine/proline transport system permease protein